MSCGDRCTAVFRACLLVILVLINSTAARDSFFVAPDLDLAPSRPLIAPETLLSAKGSDTFQFSSGMFSTFLPKIPNLEFGFNYLFGKNLRQSSFSVDYLLPILQRSDSLYFWEFHGNFQSHKQTNSVPFINNFWSLSPPGAITRTDLSWGSGYRKLFNPDFLLGVNGFYDAARIFGNWRLSGSIGIEMAANGPGDSSLDLNFNYYSSVYSDFNSRGSYFPTFNLVNDVRRGLGSFDLEAGYSTPLLDRSLDLRLKVTGYQFTFGSRHESGWKTGSEITTADGVFRVSVEYGNDSLYGTYGTVGGFVNVGLQLEDLLKCQNPFRMPEPVYRSPRNFSRLLNRPVKRNWQRASLLIANNSCEGTPDEFQFQLPVNQSGFYKGYSSGLVAFMRYLGYQIVTDTPGGKWVNGYVSANPGSNYTRDQEPMFKCMSEAYAKAARGEVVVLFRQGAYSDTTSIFYTIELPALLVNTNVTTIKAYEANVPDASLTIPANPAQWDTRPAFK